jgi:hypothetical protein
LVPAPARVDGNDGVFGIDDAPFQPAPFPNGFPSALIRGGRFGSPAGGTGARVFALSAQSSPSDFFVGIGFRCGH